LCKFTSKISLANSLIIARIDFLCRKNGGREVALKIVKSASHYREAAEDEIHLLQTISEGIDREREDREKRARAKEREEGGEREGRGRTRVERTHVFVPNFLLRKCCAQARTQKFHLKCYARDSFPLLRTARKATRSGTNVREKGEKIEHVREEVGHHAGTFLRMLGAIKVGGENHGHPLIRKFVVPF
jgi:hypothetical protein